MKEKAEDMKRKRRKQIRLMILCLAVVFAAVVIVSIVGWIRDFASVHVDTAKGTEYIRNAESEDISSIEGKIARLEEQTEGEDSRSIQEKFTGCVVAGGNTASGFEQYGVLRTSQVVARNGETLKNTEEQMKRILPLKPQIIFLAYQADELEKSGSVDAFVEEYAALIKLLKEEIPNAHIFVTSVLPSRDKGSEETCNTALAEMCEQQQAGFILCESIVESSHYEEDGIHFNESFYEEWAAYMAEVAAL